MGAYRCVGGIQTWGSSKHMRVSKHMGVSKCMGHTIIWGCPNVWRHPNIQGAYEHRGHMCYLW